MKDIFLEILLCLLAACFLMILHEGIKILTYIATKKELPSLGVSPLKFWRYIDPVGLLLAVSCYVPISKPYFFRIRDKRTNLFLGIAGLTTLFTVLAGSLLILRFRYGGIAGLNQMEAEYGILGTLPSAFVQYLSILSFGMLAANLFPVSTFDMGLLIAGVSSKAYLSIIKADGTIKLIFILTLLLGIIRYGGLRLILLCL